MKSLSLLSTGSVCFALLACSTAATAPVSNGSAGAPGAGAPATDNGGAAPVAGSPAVAGDQGVAGTNQTGGSPAVGGDDSGAGTTATAGTSAGGTSAAAGTGAGGTTSTAGTGTGGGSSAGAGAIDATVFSNGWDGALLEYPCSSRGVSVDCPNDVTCKPVWGSSAPSTVIVPSLNGAKTAYSWTVQGDATKMYDVHVLIRGVVESYNYVGGTIDTTSGTPNTRLDLFGENGTPQSNANKNNGSDYNTYLLKVTPAGGTAKNYMLNAVPNSENPHTNTTETQHRSFKITEDKHITMSGGSTVTLEVGDSNCVEIMNCGDQAGGTCGAGQAWSVPIANSTPPIPKTGSFAQPFFANNAYGQWVAFDVLDVVAK